MKTPFVRRLSRVLVCTFVGEEGSGGRVLLSLGMAGGIGVGGLLMSTLTLSGRVSPGMQLLAAPVLFVVGAALGVLHGGLLAVIGRPGEQTVGDALRRVGVAALCCAPALAAAWIVTAALSVTAALLGDRRVSFLMVTGVAGILGVVVCAWAAREAWQALVRLAQRRPGARWVGWAFVVILPVACALSLAARPVLPGTEIRPNALGAIALAVAVTVWVALPLVAALVRLMPVRLVGSALKQEAGS